MRVEGAGLRVQGAGLRVQGAGCKVRVRTVEGVVFDLEEQVPLVLPRLISLISIQ